MWKLSIATCGYAQDCTIEDYLSRIRKAGYDAVDIDLYNYYDDIMHPSRVSWARGVSAAAADAGLIIGQAHAQMGNVANIELPYESPAEIYYRNIEVCGIMGCKELVFHPLIATTIIDADEYNKLMDYNIRWFQELIEPAKTHSVRICIENAVDIRPHAIATPFTTASDIMALVDGIDESTIGICLDTGHAHIASQDIADMIRTFNKRLRVLHLHDNFGMITPVYPDHHLFPGVGTIDFSSVFNALKEINFCGTINIEPGRLERLPINVRDAVITGGALVAKAYIDDIC